MRFATSLVLVLICTGLALDYNRYSQGRYRDEQEGARLECVQVSGVALQHAQAQRTSGLLEVALQGEGLGTAVAQPG